MGPNKVRWPHINAKFNYPASTSTGSQQYEWNNKKIGTGSSSTGSQQAQKCLMGTAILLVSGFSKILTRAKLGDRNTELLHYVFLLLRHRHCSGPPIGGFPPISHEFLTPQSSVQIYWKIELSVGGRGFFYLPNLQEIGWKWPFSAPVQPRLLIARTIPETVTYNGFGFKNPPNLGLCQGILSCF